MNSPAQAPAARGLGYCLARQPILDKEEQVLGYELLFETAPEKSGSKSEGESASSAAIDTLNAIGFEAVCDGRLAFINCTQEMLTKELLLLLPSDKVVAQIQKNVPASSEIVKACEELLQRGYRIALDDFAPGDPRESLTPYAAFIKIDVRQVPAQSAAAMVKKYAGKHCRMLAQKVENRLQMIAASRDGFTLFEGYFFQHPERMRARHVPANKTGHLRLLQAISAPVVDLAEVEKLIKRDASLCYRLLRYLNSPIFGIASPVQSIRHGMNLLGERELVRWIRMATALVLAEDKCSDLVLSSMARARFCELLAPKVECGTADLFLVGMISLMDAILEVPMGVIVEGLAFDDETKAGILGAKQGSPTPLTPVYKLMVAREAGHWEQVTAIAKTLNLSLPFVNRAYNDAIAWAHQMTTGTTGEKKS